MNTTHTLHHHITNHLKRKTHIPTYPTDNEEETNIIYIINQPPYTGTPYTVINCNNTPQLTITGGNPIKHHQINLTDPNSIQDLETLINKLS